MNDKEKGLIKTYFKRADKAVNKITIPKDAIAKLGNEYLLKFYEDKIILIPISQMKGEK